MSKNINRKLQFQGPSDPLKYVEDKLPDVPPNGLLVKTEWSGICHTDVHIWKSQHRLEDDVVMHWGQLYPEFAWKWPIVMGHEAAGVICKFGSNVGKDTGGLSVGDRVVIFSWIGCGRCDYCKADQSNICADAQMYYVGCSINTPGGYQDYVAVRSVKEVCKLPDSIPGDVGCLLACSGLTAYSACQAAQGALEEAVRTTGSATLLIIGVGGLGQWAVTLSKVMFPKQTKVFAADGSTENLELARERGAIPLFWDRNADQKTIIEQTQKAVGGGVDAAIDFVGGPAMLDRAFKCAKKKASLIEVGLAGGTGKFSGPNLVRRNISIIGVGVGNIQQNRELIELCSKHKEILPPAITHIKPEEAQGVLRQLNAGTYKGRAVIDFRTS